MGEVYRAHDTNLSRDVAIKVLPAALAQDPDRLARLSVKPSAGGDEPSQLRCHLWLGKDNQTAEASSLGRILIRHFLAPPRRSPTKPEPVLVGPARRYISARLRYKRAEYHVHGVLDDHLAIRKRRITGHARGITPICFGLPRALFILKESPICAKH